MWCLDALDLSDVLDVKILEYDLDRSSYQHFTSWTFSIIVALELPYQFHNPLLVMLVFYRQDQIVLMLPGQSLW